MIEIEFPPSKSNLLEKRDNSDREKTCVLVILKELLKRKFHSLNKMTFEICEMCIILGFFNLQ